MKIHGNALDNPNLYHLYQILRIDNGDTFKYGISDDPIDTDSLSERARKQVMEMNRAVEFEKYEAKILITNIMGRLEAVRIERENIDAYYQEYGRNPLGNITPKRKA